MLEIKNLSKAYGDNQILKDISFQLDEGKIYGLIGKNGIGKTTLINCLTGVLSYEQGQVLYNHEDIQNNLIKYKEGIAYTPDECAAFEYMTGKEYIEFIYSVYYPEAKDKENLDSIAEPLIKKFDMEKYLNKLIRSYSRGTKQKISLISACLHNPDIWFLDEPLVGLDPKASAALKDLFDQRKSEGKTVFVTIHDILAAEEICDEVFLLKGQNIAKTYREVRGNDAFSIDAIRELKA
jgi:ABC-2 type transport system ATP-binding protein